MQINKDLNIEYRTRNVQFPSLTILFVFTYEKYRQTSVLGIPCSLFDIPLLILLSKYYKLPSMHSTLLI